MTRDARAFVGAHPVQETFITALVIWTHRLEALPPSGFPQRPAPTVQPIGPLSLGGHFFVRRSDTCEVVRATSQRWERALLTRSQERVIELA